MFLVTVHDAQLRLCAAGLCFFIYYTLYCWKEKRYLFLFIVIMLPDIIVYPMPGNCPEATAKRKPETAYTLFLQEEIP